MYHLYKENIEMLIINHIQTNLAYSTNLHLSEVLINRLLEQIIFSLYKKVLVIT